MIPVDAAFLQVATGVEILVNQGADAEGIFQVGPYITVRSVSAG